MIRVIIESPFASGRGYSELENVDYARECLRDSLSAGEAPLASHLLYPQVLCDAKPEERTLGIDAGHAYLDVVEYVVFYIDHGWSRGMLAARKRVIERGIPFVERRLYV